MKVRPPFFTRIFGRVNRAQVSLDSYRLILTIDDGTKSIIIIDFLDPCHAILDSLEARTLW